MLSNASSRYIVDAEPRTGKWYPPACFIVKDETPVRLVKTSSAIVLAADVTVKSPVIVKKTSDNSASFVASISAVGLIVTLLATIAKLSPIEW